ncbi:MAG: MFS transporter [Candidatus Marinimicrobia bacterium]|jgi:UMF1 family MFS transporter|nr:MFS transporter [Candidatus Neomarinimicrobiota bacterium]
MSQYKQNVFVWSLYDFANSAFTTLVVTFIYATYFTKAIAENEIIGTAQWSRAVSLTAVFVAIVSPIMGAIADRSNLRKFFLIIMTYTCVIGSVMLFFAQPGEVMKALIWFVIANIGFELGGVIYNAYLPEIAPENKIGRVSGYGWSFGYVGGLLCLVVALVGFVNPEIPWFGFSKEAGEHIRATNILVAVWFGIFSLPLILILKPKPTEPYIKSKFNLLTEINELFHTFKEIKKYKQVLKFLLARMIYNDGLVTIFAFGGIYAAGTFGFSFQEIMIFGIVLNVTAGLGAFIFGFLDDKLGGKITIQTTLIALISAGLLAIFAQTKFYFWIAGIFVGIFSGPNQAASRSLMGRFTPKSKENEFYGFFAFSGKMTAFIGPLCLGYLTEIFNSQRAGVSIVVVLFIIGLFLLKMVDEKEGVATAKISLTK